MARFNLAETRSHLRWAVRIIPRRKLSNGEEIDLSLFLKGLEENDLAKLEAAIDERDQEGFEASYRSSLTGCYGCHTASEKPYLRLKVPAEPEGAIFDFTPAKDSHEGA